MKPIFKTVDPATNTLKQTFKTLTKSQIQKALLEADRSFLTYKAWTLKARSEILNKVAKELEADKQSLARIISLEMGKPLAESEAEIMKCASACRFYADNGAEFLADEITKTTAKKSFVMKKPLGTILAIMPWNFPFFQVFRVAAPALMAGNTVLLKPAINVPQCALAIEKIFISAGLPLNVFQTLFASHEDIAKILSHRGVAGVSFTGSLRGGKEVAKLASEHMKPCVMELGGNDPFIVFEDANLEAAVKNGVYSRCLNAGQSCIAAKRFLIHETLFESFSRKASANAKTLIMGDPLDPKTTMGPLATKKQQEMFHDQIKDALNKGAALICGGEIPDSKGFFYPATVIAKVNPSMRIWHEEAFGPLMTLISFKNDDEALAIANDTIYGLGASIWTQNKNRINYFVDNIESGSVFVNDFVRSDPILPFGGIKNSGFGRELGKEGILSFVNIKTIWKND